MPNIQITVPSLPLPERLDAYLTKALAGRFSRQEAKAAIESGAIVLNGKKARPSALVKAGDRLEGDIPTERKSALEAENLPLQVIYEDESLLVIDKAVGMAVHPGAGRRQGTLVNALLGRGGKLSAGSGVDRPGIVHRLDKDTSGLIVVAKNNAAHRFLQNQFALRTFTKIYTALVKGKVEFDRGHITDAIGRDPRVRNRMAVSSEADAREAHTQYRVLERHRHTTLLEVKILTGRTHQIRVHMAHIGHPVVGDRIYGSKQDPAARLALHATEIEFVHPVTQKKVKFHSSPPKDFPVPQ
ncbi:MAG: RluA family pseudouridine synthase [Candidatus Omnitrophica bacterium]|nr:RluA family pseudouridine synthase [Candidatus Omnitrophota bacterium]